MEEILGLRRSDQKAGDGKLAAQVNAVAVLDMIKSLQEEIKVGSNPCGKIVVGLINIETLLVLKSFNNPKLKKPSCRISRK